MLTQNDTTNKYSPEEVELRAQLLNHILLWEKQPGAKKNSQRAKMTYTLNQIKDLRKNRKLRGKNIGIRLFSTQNGC